MIAIQTVYRLDGHIFESRKEAEDHLKRIKLFDLFTKTIDPAFLGETEYKVFSNMLEIMIRENKAVIEILE
jgi:hypothetical protein